MASFENSFLEFVYYTYKSLKKKISSKFFLTTIMYENRGDICNSIVTPLFFDRLSFRTSASRRRMDIFASNGACFSTPLLGHYAIYIKVGAIVGSGD